MVLANGVLIGNVLNTLSKQCSISNLHNENYFYTLEAQDRIISALADGNYLEIQGNNP
jgi:hypothetical protein